METYTEGGEIVEHSGGGWGSRSAASKPIRAPLKPMTNAGLDIFRYMAGAMPYCCRKAAVNWLLLPYPTDWATPSTLREEFLSKSYYVEGGFSNRIHMTAAHLW